MWDKAMEWRWRAMGGNERRSSSGVAQTQDPHFSSDRSGTSVRKYSSTKWEHIPAEKVRRSSGGRRLDWSDGAAGALPALATESTWSWWEDQPASPGPEPGLGGWTGEGPFPPLFCIVHNPKWAPAGHQWGRAEEQRRVGGSS